MWVAVGNASANTDQGRTEPMAEDGSFSLTVTVPAWADGTQYAIYASKAHGQGFSDPSQNVIAAIDWASESLKLDRPQDRRDALVILDSVFRPLREAACKAGLVDVPSGVR